MTPKYGKKRPVFPDTLSGFSGQRAPFALSGFSGQREASGFSGQNLDTSTTARLAHKKEEEAPGLPPLGSDARRLLGLMALKWLRSNFPDVAPAVGLSEDEAVEAVLELIAAGLLIVTARRGADGITYRIDVAGDDV